VAGAERSLLRDIERLLRAEIPQTIVPGFEPGQAPLHEPDARPAHSHAPRRHSGGGGGRQGGGHHHGHGRSNGRNRSQGQGQGQGQNQQSRGGRGRSSSNDDDRGNR